MEAATVPQSAFDGSVFQIPQPIKFSLTWLYIANTALQTTHKKKKKKVADPKAIHWKRTQLFSLSLISHQI